MQLHAVEDISDQGHQVHPSQQAVVAVGRGLASAVLWVFVALSWLFGLAWRGLKLCVRAGVSVADLFVLAVDYGFRAGAGWPPREAKKEADETSPVS